MAMPTTSCQVCEKKFYVKPSHKLLGWGKYCSKACKINSQKKGKIVTCAICEKKVYKSLGQLAHSKSKKYFCSKTCQTTWRNTYYIEEKHPNWLGGKESYRNILLRTGRQRKCISCGLVDERILIAHHIDHNRNNNDPQNLTWMCLNCHFLVHHDKRFENKIKKHMVPVAQLV